MPSPLSGCKNFSLPEAVQVRLKVRWGSVCVGSASLLAAKAVLTPSLKEKALVFANIAQQLRYGHEVLSPAHILSPSLLPPFSCSLPVGQVFWFPPRPSAPLMALHARPHMQAEGWLPPL